MQSQASFPTKLGATRIREELKQHPQVKQGRSPGRVRGSNILCVGESESMGWKGIMDHMRTHMATTNICCDVVGCGYEAFDRIDFKKHVLTHQHVCYTHGLEPRYSCTASGCGYSTSSRLQLETHLVTHLHEKPYRCTAPGCGYTTWSKVLLGKHMEVHMHRERMCGNVQILNSRNRPQQLAYQANREQAACVDVRGESIFNCAIGGCDYESRLQTEFEADMLTHTCTTPYQCKTPG